MKLVVRSTSISNGFPKASPVALSATSSRRRTVFERSSTRARRPASTRAFAGAVNGPEEMT